MFAWITYPDIAFSGAMQLLLFFSNLLFTFFNYYLITNLILEINEETTQKRRKVLYCLLLAFFINGVIYLIFLVGQLSFNPITYVLVTHPSPLHALFFCVLAIRVLGVSKYRTAIIVVQAYYYTLITNAIGRVLALGLFPQVDGPYNYFADLLGIVAASIAYYLIYRLAKFLISIWQLSIKVSDQMFVKSITWELMLAFFKTLPAYCVIIFLPILLDNQVLAYLFAAFVILLLLIITILSNYKRAMGVAIENRDACIKSLTISIENFSSVKHDFYNILNTYSGYISLGEMNKLAKYHEELLSTTVRVGDELDLNKKMSDNPAFISLLINKLEHAEEIGVFLHVSILSDASDFYIDNIDICRINGGLLDIAIEVAKNSDQKRVTFSLQQKKDGRRLIVITSSSADDFDIASARKTAPLEEDVIISNISKVHKLVGKYANCTLQIVCADREMTSYLELQRTN